MKKLVSFLLAALMVLGLFTVSANAENDLAFQKFDHVVEVHIGKAVSPTDTSLLEGDTVEDNFYTRYLLENYNIKAVIDWTAADGSDFNQKVALCIASDNLPDVIRFADRTYFVAAVENDLLYDLKPVYEKYASDQLKSIYNITEGLAEQQVTFNGKMLGLPAVTVSADGVNVMMVQQNWLDTLGLAAPTTVQELHDVLASIRDAKPAGDRTIPMIGAAKDGRVYNDFLHTQTTQNFDPIFAAMGAYPGYFLADEEGKVQYGTLTNETRAALELLANWYAEGLIDPEFATRDNSSDPINANECAVYCGPWWSLGYGNASSFQNSATVNWQAYPLLNEDGAWTSKMKNLGDQYTVLNANVSEEVAAALIVMTNVLVKNESNFANKTTEHIDWYPVRTVLSAMNECEYTYAALISVLEGETEPEDWAAEDSTYKLLASDTAAARETVPGYKKGEQIMREYFVSDIKNNNFIRQYSQLIGIRPYATTEMSKAVYSAVYSTNDAIDRYWANLETLENAIVRSIITGKRDITAFDDFVKQWMNEGGAKVLEAVQAEYDMSK